MEIRTLDGGEREKLLQLLEGFPLGDGRKTLEYFDGRFDHDPTFDPENVVVAVDHGELLGCLQIVPRWLLILGHRIPAAGVSHLFVQSAARGQGLAEGMLEHATRLMRERGMELSLLFAPRPTLFDRLGWRTWLGQRTVLRRSEKGIAPKSTIDDAADIELVRFEPGRDRGLSSVKAIHTAYSASRHGTVLRDDGLWEASLVLAGNPDEEFFIARRGGLAVAYARATVIDEVLTVTEMGRFEDGARALSKLIASMLDGRGADPLASGGRESAALRSFLVLPTFDDIALTVGLEQEGAASHPMDDRSGMLRCLNLNALAARLDVDLLDDEDGERFLARILPPDGFVFWPADRF